MIIIGVDIGLSGAVAAFNTSNEAALVFDLPVTDDEEVKRLAARPLIHLLRTLAPAPESALLVAEDIRVRAFKGRPMSHNTETQVVGARFTVQAVADIMRLEARWIQPQSWKRHFGLMRKKDEKDSAYKARSMAVARSLFPGAADDLARAMDHNRAEALLIAKFGTQFA
jgi:crossover junction endodeoxyribonuclease RuvC